MEVRFEIKGYRAGELKTSVETNEVVDSMMLIALIRELYDDMSVRLITEKIDETRHYGKENNQWKLLDVSTNQKGRQA